MTFAIPVQRSANWAIKPLGAGHFVTSHADVLRLVTRSSPRTSAQRTGHFRSLAVSLILKEPICCYVHVDTSVVCHCLGSFVLHDISFRGPGQNRENVKFYMTCCLLAFYIVAPGPAVWLELFAYFEKAIRFCRDVLMFLPSVLSSLCLASSMHRFIPPLSVLAPHDSYFSRSC